jgi:plastocyanin
MLLSLAATLALAVSLAACGDGDDGGGGSVTGDVVVIEDFDFTIPVGLEPGATVTVRNDDGVTHTFTADDDSFDTGNVPGGGTAEVSLPAQGGDYAVHCEIHRSMSATVTLG